MGKFKSLSEAYKHVLIGEMQGEDTMNTGTQSQQPITSNPAGAVFNTSAPSPTLPSVSMDEALNAIQDGFKKLKILAKKQTGYDEVSLKKEVLEMFGETTIGMKMFEVIQAFIALNKE